MNRLTALNLNFSVSVHGNEGVTQSNLCGLMVCFQVSVELYGTERNILGPNTHSVLICLALPVETENN